MVDLDNNKITSLEKKEKSFFCWTFFTVAITLFYVCFTAQTTYDSGDGLAHYFISRFARIHPSLLLDSWGKPLFTILSSPFSQFGLFGISLFQLICALATSYFCWRIAKKLDLKFAWLLPLLICFTPIYFAVINSGLTEILFGCLLMFSIWMIFENKFIIAAIAASFLPFVRVDAYVTMPLIAIVLCSRKQFGSLLFLCVGFITYSVIGYFYYKDPLWVIHQSQSFFDEGYPGMKGEFFHYPRMYKEIWGTSFSILLVIGIIYVLFDLYSILISKTKKLFFSEQFFLIYGSFFACLLIHTLSYCLPGVLNNLGMTRYMATLIPCSALIALSGLNLLLIPFKKFNSMQIIIATAFTVSIIATPFGQWYYPFVPDGEQRVCQETAKWMKDTNLSFNKICFFHPALPVYFDVDPFDDKKVIRYLNLNDPIPSDFFPAGSLMIWDAHFGANEGGIPSEKLDGIPALQLLRKFRPENPFTVLGGGEFEIRIYQVK